MTSKTALAQVKGLGSAKDGAHHWWLQRTTGVLLILLNLWFMWAFSLLPSHDFETITTWLQELPVASAFSALVATMAFHSYLGVQVVIEDYVATKSVRTVALLFSQFGHLALGIFSVLAVIRIALGDS